MMKNEHPIIFSTEMVRAILAGAKTQTRRVISDEWWRCLDPEDEEDRVKALSQCPYGKSGDHLYVRETWALMCRQADPICWCESDEQKQRNHYYEYKADTGNPYPGEWDADDARGCEDAPKWKPSIHMPRVASRITLEITRVRVERLQDMSAEDCLSEGMVVTGGSKLDVFKDFKVLWNSINAKRGFSWDANPWVWVIEFEKTVTAQ